MYRRSPRAIKTSEIRRSKRHRRECRACTEPAAFKNGKTLVMCQAHLDKDSERKKVKR